MVAEGPLVVVHDLADADPDAKNVGPVADGAKDYVEAFRAGVLSDPTRPDPARRALMLFLLGE